MEKPKIIGMLTPDAISQWQQIQSFKISDNPLTDAEFSRLNNLEVSQQENIFQNDENLALSFFQQKRAIALQDFNGHHGEDSIKEFKYWNTRILNSKKHNFENCDAKDGTMEKKFEEFVIKRLFDILDSEYYLLTPGTSITTSKGFENHFFNYSFKLSINTVNTQEKNIECNFDLNDKDSSKSFIGNIRIDSKEKKISLKLLPSINNIDESADDNFKPKFKHKLETLVGITYLMKKPKYHNVPYQDGRINEAISNNKKNNQISVGDEIKESIMSFKRRTVDKVENSWDEALDLIDSLSKEDLALLRARSNNNLILNVHYYSRLNNEPTAKISFLGFPLSSAGKIGECSEKDRAGLEHLVSEALNKGEHAVISINGRWVPPEFDGLPRGKSKRAHLRRGTKLIIILGGKFSDDGRNIKNIVRAVNSGKPITAEQKDNLDSFCRENNIDNYDQIEFSSVEKDWIHLANGNISKNSQNTKNGGEYIIRQ